MTIVAVDFDNTLCYSRWPELGNPNEKLIRFLINWKNNEHKLILWTCRTGNMLEAAVEWCREQGLEFDAINENLEEQIQLYGTDSRKISANYYVDDKCICPDKLIHMLELEK